ncbi:MAG: DUF424 family protein [Nanoarchaeota archaeon]|nr:DUF424 family protein [Nanoarchaeota archaeon]
MLLKVHESYRKVVALCDSELLGRKLEEGKRQLEVGEHFFKGDEVSHDEAVARLRQLALDDSTFNIVGEKSVRVAVEAGILEEGGFSEIEGVKFGLVLL